MCKGNAFTAYSHVSGQKFFIFSLISENYAYSVVNFRIFAVNYDELATTDIQQTTRSGAPPSRTS